MGGFYDAIDKLLQAPPDEKQVIKDYVRGHEGVSAAPYKDTNGILTTGVGHQVRPGDKPMAPEAQLDIDIDTHIDRAKSLFPKFDSYPITTKKALVDGVFRGEYKKGQKTVDYINSDQWDKVPAEYINREDYKKSKDPKNKQGGIYKRMDENAGLLRQHPRPAKKPGSMSALNPFNVATAEAAEPVSTQNLAIDQLLTGQTEETTPETDSLDTLLAGGDVPQDFNLSPATPEKTDVVGGALKIMREDIKNVSKKTGDIAKKVGGAAVEMAKDVPAQVTDLTNIPYLTLDHPPYKSKLFTQGLPELINKTGEAVPTGIPDLSVANLTQAAKMAPDVISGKLPVLDAIKQLESTPTLSIQELAMIGLATKGAVDMNRAEMHVNKMAKTAQTYYAVADNIEPLTKLAGLKFPEGMSVYDRSQIILKMAEESPKMGSVITGLKNGKIRPLGPGDIKTRPVAPAPAEPAPQPTGIIPQVTAAAQAPAAVPTVPMVPDTGIEAVKPLPFVQAPEVPAVVHHFTETPDKALSIGSMDSDIGVHFGTEGAAKNRGQFKTGQMDKYDLANVNKVLQVDDIGGNHDDPRAVFPMLEAAGGLTSDQTTFLKDTIPVLEAGNVEAYYKANDEWLKQANRLLTENGYTHARYLNKSEGGESWIALTDKGFKKHVDIIPSQSGVTLIKKVPAKAPAGTIAFNDLIKSKKIDQNAVYTLLKEKTLMRWKKTKGMQTTDFDTKINSIIDQAYTHLPNRNWNPATQASIEAWIDSAADSAVKVAINELSHPSGNAEIRKDVAELTAVMDKMQEETGSMPSLQDIVGPKEEPTELTKKWGPTKVVRIYLEKMSSEQGVSYEHLTETFEIGTETGIEFNAGVPVPIKFPSVKEMVDNTQELCAYSKEAWHRITDPLRFFPQLKDFPAFKNSIRVDFIGANIEAKMWVDQLYGGIFGQLNAKDQSLAIEILKYKSQVERIKLGRISPVTLEEAQSMLAKAVESATPEVMLAAQKWNTLEKVMQQDLITRGKLDPEQAMEDHVAFYVDAYTKDWMLWSSVPRRLKRPFRGYLRFARGTTKQYRVDMDTLLASMYRIKMDNALEDFTFKWLNKLDILKDMSLEQKIALFGETTVFGNVAAKSPRPNAVYEIDGVKYVGYQFEHSPRTAFKTEEGLIALGRLHKVYLIPEDVIDVFKNFKPVSDPFIGAIMFQWNRMNSFFKSTAIFSIFPKYNVNNFVGDAYMLYMQSPKSFLKLDSALKYLVKSPLKYNDQEKALTQWMKEQRVLSTFAEAELAHFKNNPLNLLAWSNKTSEFREKILRTCLAMRLYENMAAGKSLHKQFDWIATEGLSVSEANGKIAREVLVDYLSTSNTFNKYMKGAAIPFGTWFAKATGLLSNLFKKHPFKTLISLLAPIIAMDMYNNTADRRKIEDKLPSYIRNRTHIVIGASKPGKAWVLVLQLPIDCLPIFPLVNIGMKNAFKMGHGELTGREAAKNTLSETTTASLRIGEFLLTPLYRFIKGVQSNKDPVTQAVIVPREGKVGALYKFEIKGQGWEHGFIPEVRASGWIPKVTAFAATTLIPPMSLALRAEKRIEYIDVDNMGNTIKQWFSEWWDPVRALGFVEASLTGKSEELLQAADKATRKYNNIMVRYAEDISSNKQQDPSYYVDLAKKDGLVKSSTDESSFMGGLANVARNPQWRILNMQEKLRHTEDPAKRKLIEEQIQWMQNYKRSEFLKATPKGARGEALRDFTNK